MTAPKMLRVKNKAGAVVGAFHPVGASMLRDGERTLLTDSTCRGWVLRESVADVCIAIDAALRGEERDVTEAGDD